MRRCWVAIIGVLIAIIVVFLLVIVVLYNALVRLRNQMKNAWSQIEVQLKRRHDLIPNLVETVRGYAKHERETLEEVTKARNQAMEAKELKDKIEAEGGLVAALTKLMAISESYPDLKANQNFLALQEELTSTENKIGFARQHYNDSVMVFNNKIQMFPSNMIATMFNFKEGIFFEIKDVTEKAVPQVSFS